MKKRSRSLAIEVKRISKKYLLRHQKPTLTDQFFSSVRKEEFQALKNVSFKVFDGEKVGIIGSNGSGKTTLLKTIAGITTPSQGAVKTQGKIVSLIGLDAGFHPDLTGEENIYLNGLIIGMSRREIQEKFAEIVAFADIGQFIDAPLFTYSQGMMLRLGFAVAVHSDPDILILDEGLATGDNEFQQKISKKIQEFFREGKTILVVTHWLTFLEEHVQRVIWLDRGKIKADGPTKKNYSSISKIYSALTFHETRYHHYLYKRKRRTVICTAS